jgi:hypothetical protein
MIIGTLEGALLIARTYRDPDRFAGAARRLLAEITTPVSRTPTPGQRRHGRRPEAGKASSDARPAR